MPVPTGNNDKTDTTTGVVGSFTAAKEGGTILSNETTGDVITKALALKDNATAWNDGTKPKVLADGLQGNQKVLTAGTFAYEAAGKYVIAASSDTLAGVASTKMLITGRGSVLNSINQFEHDFGAKTVTLMRRNRYSRTGYLLSGDTKVKKRSANLFLSATGHAHHTPATNTTTDMWAPGGSARNGTGATARYTDVAANPTRAIPGRLVMKANFITSELDPWTATEPGSDFYKYKPITGM